MFCFSFGFNLLERFLFYSPDLLKPDDVLGKSEPQGTPPALAPQLLLVQV